MQRVNVCLQALCKRLPKSCREQEKEEEEEEEEGARKWQARGVRNSENKNQQVPGLSVTDDSRECAVTPSPGLHNQHPSSSPSPFLRAAVRSTRPLVWNHSSLPSVGLNSAPTGPQSPEHWGWLNEQGRGVEERGVNGSPHFQSPPPLLTVLSYHPAKEDNWKLASSKEFFLELVPLDDPASK